MHYEGGSYTNAIHDLQIIWKIIFQWLKENHSKICFISYVLKIVFVLRSPQSQLCLLTQNTHQSLWWLRLFLMLSHAKSGSNFASSFQLHSFHVDSIEYFYSWPKDTIVFFIEHFVCRKAECLCENNSNLFSQHLCNALFLNEGTWIVKWNYQFFQVQVIKLGGGNCAKCV